MMFLNLKLTLNISSSTECNIIKRQSGDISVNAGHSWKSIFEACDLQALGPCCIKNKQDSVMEIYCMGSGAFPEIPVCEHN